MIKQRTKNIYCMKGGKFYRVILSSYSLPLYRNLFKCIAKCYVRKQT